jgi:cob(I)alamin adenosyltransferase
MSKLYTGKGDKGNTKNFAGEVFSKDDLLIETLGNVDSLQSAIDLVILDFEGGVLEFLEEVQKKLWQLSGEIANCPGDCLPWPIKKEDIEKMEEFIDSLGEFPKRFVRFDTKKAIEFNECRVRCRALERKLVGLSKKRKIREELLAYINRLSSAFFMLGFVESEK